MPAVKAGTHSAALRSSIKHLDLPDEAEAVVRAAQGLAEQLDGDLDADTAAKVANTYLRFLKELREWQKPPDVQMGDAPVVEEDPFETLAKALGKAVDED